MVQTLFLQRSSDRVEKSWPLRCWVDWLLILLFDDDVLIVVSHGQETCDELRELSLEDWKVMMKEKLVGRADMLWFYRFVVGDSQFT